MPIGGMRGRAGSPPPIHYPMPSRVEAIRRTPSMVISTCGFILIMATMFGLMHIRYGEWLLGAIEIMIGFSITVIVWRKFHGTV